ncbi:MAG: PaaI family thioesterase [Proteobacteria bacterium]|nr:MAG: PaaI family thioesterase [Pseudomonadota bacterium]
MNWLQPKVVSVEHGKLVFSHAIRPEMTNPFGTLHGGVTAAIIDDAIGATLISFGEPFHYVTVNLTIDYFASARSGDVILAETNIIKKGKTIVNAEGSIWNDDRTKLLARGYTNLIKTEIK